MTKMKNIIVALALMVGCVGVSFAGNPEWNVTIMTGTSITIGGSQAVNLRRIINSSGTTASLGDYVQGFRVAPSPSNGEGPALMPRDLFVATAAVTPAIVFNTTTSVTGSGTSINNVWSIGECEACYIRVPADSNGGTLHFRKSSQGSGGANITAIIWSN